VPRRQLGNLQGIAAALANLGRVTSRQGEYERANALHAESLALFEQLADQSGIANCLNNLGRPPATSVTTRWRRNISSGAWRYFASYRIAAASPSVWRASAIAASEGGRDKRPGSCERPRASTNRSTPAAPADRPLYERAVAGARAQLDEPAFRPCWTAGRTMPLDQVVAEMPDGVV
jgi:hypothetical protein